MKEVQEHSQGRPNVVSLEELKVERVANNDERVLEFIMTKHYAKRRPSISYAYLLMDKEGNALGALTYGKPASNQLCIGVCGKEYSSSVYELNRLILLDGLPKNTSTYFISRCEKLLAKEGNFIIVSYSDTGMGHNGYTYQASNFLYTGATARRTDKYVPKGKHSRHYVDSEDTAHLRKVRTSKHRYVKFVGNKRFKRDARRSLNYPVQDYPKGDNEYYELGDEYRTLILDRKSGNQFYE